jgi:von Willebrand factor type A domain
VAAASLTLLTPLGGLVALAALFPVGAVALTAALGRRAANTLGLGPARWRTYTRPALLAASICLLLGLAASQPVLRTGEPRLVREASQAFFVVDVSRSMLASSGPGARTRLERARAAVERLREAVPDVPAGLAGLTDRVLPYAFPTADAQTFAATLARSVAVEAPPPQDVDTVATSFAALPALVGDGYFDKQARTRTCVVVTDGESRPFSSGELARSLGSPRGCRLVVVRVGGPGDRVFRTDGTPEGSYRPDAAAPEKAAQLAAAGGGRAFDERQLDGAVTALRRAAETGPTVRTGSAPATRRLAPYLAGAALALALVLVASRVAGSRLGRRTSVAYDPSWQQ